MAAVTGTLTPGQRSASFPVERGGSFNLTVSGPTGGAPDSGFAWIERSYDTGATWHQRTDLSAAGPNASAVFQEPEAGVLYSLNYPAGATSTLTYRFSQ